MSYLAHIYMFLQKYDFWYLHQNERQAPVFSLILYPLLSLLYLSLLVHITLYGCETLSLTLREEHRLRAYENRVLRRIFGPKRDEVTGGWRKLHNEELHGLYSSPGIVRVIKARRIRWAGHMARVGR
jgi:hypothetical protein